MYPLTRTPWATMQNIHVSEPGVLEFQSAQRKLLSDWMQWKLEERWISATAWWDWLMRPRSLMLAGPATSGNNAIGSCCKWFVTAVIAMYSELKLAEPWWYQGHPRAMDEKKPGPEWLTPHFQQPVSTHFQHRRTSNTQRTHSQRPKVTHFQRKKQVSASVARQFQYLPHQSTPQHLGVCLGDWGGILLLT